MSDETPLDESAIETRLQRALELWTEKHPDQPVTLLPAGEPEPWDGWCEYLVDPDADWYHPTWCHRPDHHEWLHAELSRQSRRLVEAEGLVEHLRAQVIELQLRGN